MDIRTVPGQDHRRLYARLQEYLGEEVDLKVLTDVAYLWSDPEEPWIREVLEIAGRIKGRPLEPDVEPVFTDGPYVQEAFGGPPTLILGPGTSSQAHRADEYCRVELLEEAVELYAEVIDHWCGGKR
jgi:succinyl-diaminopimelate desuccinylase